MNAKRLFYAPRAACIFLRRARELCALSYRVPTYALDVQLQVKVGTRTQAVPTATSPRHSPPTSLDLSDELDLDGHVARQRVGAHRRARVDASLAEDGAQQLGGAVEDLGLLREVGRAVDEADHLDDPLHAVEVAWFRQMEAAKPSVSEARPAHSLTLPWAEPDPQSRFTQPKTPFTRWPAQLVLERGEQLEGDDLGHLRALLRRVVQADLAHLERLHVTAA